MSTKELARLTVIKGAIDGPTRQNRRPKAGYEHSMGKTFDKEASHTEARTKVGELVQTGASSFDWLAGAFTLSDTDFKVTRPELFWGCIYANMNV
jgi:hypothetical protein